MSKVLVFTIAFIAIFGLTLIIPSLPLGEQLLGYFGFMANWSFFGMISGATLVNGIVNGIFWGLLILGFYIIASRVSRKDTLPPMPRPSYIPEHVPEKTEKKYPTKKPAPRIVKRRTFVPLDQEIETIEGIGPTYGSRFRSKGIRIIEDLLRVGSTKKRRRELANDLGVAPKTLLKWVYRADFFRLRGIGKQYSSLLESAGVNTVVDLSRRNPKNLHSLLKETNMEKNLVRRIPHLSQIENWIEDAKKLAAAF